jgi:hypothetical protein
VPIEYRTRDVWRLLRCWRAQTAEADPSPRKNRGVRDDNSPLRHGRDGITRGVSFCNGLFFIVLGLSYIADDGKGLTSGLCGQAACLHYMWTPWACGLRGGPWRYRALTRLPLWPRF